MNTTLRHFSLSALVAAAAALGIAPAAYADSSDPVQGPIVGGKTRAQVQAELQAARANGDVVVSIAGLKAYEVYPDRYPAHAAASLKTRQQVQSELAAAVRSGDVIANVESALTVKELAPHHQAPQRQAPARASVASVAQPVSVN